METQAKVQMTTAIYGLIRFILEPKYFTLYTFQAFVFTYLKRQRQCLYNYQLFKLF